MAKRSKLKEVRIGVIGVGNMGGNHSRRLLAGDVPRCRLTAVCDIDPERHKPFKDENVKIYSDSRELIRSGEVDAVLIATPHYDHTTIGMDALGQGLHVLVEKPISVHKADCERLIKAYRGKGQVFAAMFNQRTDPHYIKLKELVESGELGEIMRVNWVITNWFRSEMYYKSGGWRATWKGEGGGVLLNQCPHNLDLLQWICGMPSKVQGFCKLGQRHNIEVEDAVTAYLEYPNGATGVFVTSTGEAPGANRLEVVGERGQVVVEHGKVMFRRNVESVTTFSKTTKKLFASPEIWNVEIPVKGGGAQHLGIMQNFVEAILDGKPLIADAREGIHSVELANAMLHSSFTGKPVDMPLNGQSYERRLKKLIRESRVEKKTVKAKPVDMSDSF